MQIKIHRSHRNVVAIADTEIIGKKFEQGLLQLDVRENFYKDKEVSKEELIKLIQFHKRDDATFNIVGKESCQTAIEAGLISKEAIGKVQNIPFALTLL